MRALLKIGMATALLVASLGVGSGVAQAEPMPPAGTTTSASSGDAVCDQARTLSRQSGPCATRITSGQSNAVPATSAQLQADGNIVAADGTRLSAAAGTVYTKTWWQEQRGLYYVNWVERHEGRIYFDRTKVWVAPNYGYNGGYHRCDLGFGIGYDVQVRNCLQIGDPNSVSVDNYDQFRVSVIFRGFPVYATYSMTARTTRDGAVIFF